MMAQLIISIRANLALASIFYDREITFVHPFIECIIRKLDWLVYLHHLKMYINWLFLGLNGVK